MAFWERELGRAAGRADVEGDNLAFRAIGDRTGAPAYVRAVSWLHEWARRVQAWWHGDGHDLLLTPTLAVPPPPLGYLSDPDLGGARVRDVLQYTAQFNITGQPAVSLPLHWTSKGKRRCRAWCGAERSPTQSAFCWCCCASDLSSSKRPAAKAGLS